MSKFILKELHKDCIGVWYENDDIQVCVGALSNDRVLTATREKVTLLNITRRLMS